MENVQYILNVKLPFRISGTKVRGAELIEAVKKVANHGVDTQYVSESDGCQGEKIGRTSRWPRKELMVMVGTDNQQFIHRLADYNNVKVIYNSWSVPGLSKYGLSPTQETVEKEVTEFVRLLEKVLNGESLEWYALPKGRTAVSFAGESMSKSTKELLVTLDNEETFTLEILPDKIDELKAEEDAEVKLAVLLKNNGYEFALALQLVEKIIVNKV